MSKINQAGLSGVIGALNLKMRLHIAKRTGVAAFHKSGSGYALALRLNSIVRMLFLSSHQLWFSVGWTFS